jgi:hypothetical protein
MLNRLIVAAGDECFNYVEFSREENTPTPRWLAGIYRAHV